MIICGVFLIGCGKQEGIIASVPIAHLFIVSRLSSGILLMILCDSGILLVQSFLFFFYLLLVSSSLFYSVFPYNFVHFLYRKHHVNTYIVIFVCVYYNLLPGIKKIKINKAYSRFL